MEPSVFWSMMEAIGTIFAAGVALFFGLREDIRKWYNRPMVKLEYQREFMRIENSSCRMPVKISNVGRTTAYNVKIKLMEIIQNDKNLMNPSARMFVFDVESLPSSDFSIQHFLMFSRVEGKEMRVYAFYNRDSPSYSGRYIPKQDTRFRLIISGDNFASLQVTFDFIDSDDYSKMTLKKI